MGLVSLPGRAALKPALVATVSLLALVGVAAVIAAIIVIHPGGAPRQFSGHGCDFRIQFNGTTLDDKDTPSILDDEYTWSYTVWELDGDPGCGLSHWVLALCTEAFDAYLDSAPDPSFLVTNDPGTTGLTGVKWNDIPDVFQSGTFTVTLRQNFALDPDVDVGFKTGASVVVGTIEGPSCEVPTPTPTSVVGGVMDIRVDGSESLVGSTDEGSAGSSPPPYAAIAGGLAAAAVAIAAGGWYARRRLS